MGFCCCCFFVVADLHSNTETQAAHLEVFSFYEGSKEGKPPKPPTHRFGEVTLRREKTYNLHSLTFISYSFREDTGLLLDLVESSDVHTLHLQQNKSSS